MQCTIGNDILSVKNRSLSACAQDLSGEMGYPKKVDIEFGAWPDRARTVSTMSVPEPDPSPHSRTDSVVSLEPDSEPVQTPEVSKTQLTARHGNLARNARFRKSCYFESTMRCGVIDWSSYNHMLLPSKYDWYSGPEDEYYHLKNHVCIWDVAAERQVELVGPDAVVLAELLTPRALGDMPIGQCRYAVIVDDEGMVLNDPVVSRIAEDQFWLSGADGDLILWAKGLAVGKGLNVKIREAAVSPLALQGPKSVELLAELFGDWIYDLKYFKFKEVALNGIPIVLARSGWSPEVGYELYCQDESRGNELWQIIWEAGQKYNIKPGSPNQKRRIEGGMLNFGSDITEKHNLCELGLPPSWTGAPGKCKAADFIGKEALTRFHEQGGPARRIVGLQFDTKQACAPLTDFWDIQASGAECGMLTSLTHSPTLDAWIGIATLANEAALDTKVSVQTPDGPREATVRKLPFLPRVAMLPRPETTTA